MSHRHISLLAVALASACSEPVAAPVGFPHVWAVNDCAPWDGPAVTVYFSTDEPASGVVAPPFLSVSVWTGPLELVGRSHGIAAEDTGGAARWCDRDGSCRNADAGSIRFHAFEPEERLEGVITARFGVEVVEGSFTAQWRGGQPLCG